MAFRLARSASRGAFCAVPSRAVLSVLAVPTVALPPSSATAPTRSFSAAASAPKPAPKASPKGFARVGVAPARVSAPAVNAAAANAAAAAARKAEVKRVPALSAVMRSLVTKVHPDLFTAYPEQLQVNETSLSMLQGYLSALKDATGSQFPGVRNEKLPFYFRTNTPGSFRLVNLVLHVPGGKNKEAITTQLTTFFKSVGLADSFTWDREYFPLKEPPSRSAAEAERAAEEKERAEEAAAGNAGAHKDESYEEFQARIQEEARKKHGGKSKEEEDMFKGFYEKYAKKKSKK